VRGTARSAYRARNAARLGLRKVFLKSSTKKGELGGLLRFFASLGTGLAGLQVFIFRTVSRKPANAVKEGARFFFFNQVWQGQILNRFL